MSDMHEKLAALTARFRRLPAVAVAFSGGVDSTFLLKVAHDALGARTVAVTGRSLSFPERELNAAKKFCADAQIRHLLVDAEELAVEGFADNPPERCYLCKKELFGQIQKVAAANGIAAIAEASNLDDESDYRPGHRAIAEAGVLSPLREARLTKAEIRELSRELGLPTWDKPSFACLASRFPFGEKISAEKLRQLDRAEQFLLDLGFRTVRVRLHENGKLARIELDAGDIARCAAAAMRQKIGDEFSRLGFTYIALDLRGYRTGSMNATLPNNSQLTIHN
ncbi:MAG: ATP-dependent sacrificial sulfur transferase LarE [Planctomycetota bacterium]|jgi:uncharacterized protein|nr:ATP-dependent sacrificial sulfur transferase LarE [Planctomycetota bacterium]